MRRLAFILAVMAAACHGGEMPVVIAVAGPFSQPSGESVRLAAQLAAREINAQGGVRGRPLELLFADDSARDSVAVRVARHLRDDARVMAVVGHVTSTATLAALPVYTSGDHPVVVVSPSASSPELSGSSPYFFRVCPSDLAHGPRLARFARQTLAAATAAIIYANDDYGRGLYRTFAAEFERLGGRTVSEDPALPTTPSVEPYLARLRAAGGADVLVLAAERSLGQVTLREMAALGIAWPIVGGDALTGVSGARAEGIHISSAYLPDDPGTRNAEFVQSYTRAYPGRLPDHRGAAAYDIIHVLAQIIDNVGPGRAVVRNGLAALGTNGPGYEGVTGTIAFDEQGDVPNKSVMMGVVRDGRLVNEAAP